MPTSESTCWTVNRAAVAGSLGDHEKLAHRYLSVVRAYLAVRWRGSALQSDLDDAVQEVFVECVRQGDVLDAAGAGRVPNFRVFLYGVVRNVAQRFESQPMHATAPRSDIAMDEASLSRLFERSWARAIMTEAAQRQRQGADQSDPDAVRRVKLLRLRFEKGLPIRAIAEHWAVPAATLYHDYAQARQEFRAALLEHGQTLATASPHSRMRVRDRGCTNRPPTSRE